MSGVKQTAIFLMAVFVLFCAYWAIGRSTLVKTISSNISNLQSQGYKVIHKGHSVGGFPFKFRSSLAELDLASPRSIDKPWSIKANDWRIEALAINPLKWTASHRGEARIDLRGPKGERWLFDARPFNIDITARASFSGELKKIDLRGTKLKTQAVIGTLPPIIAIDAARMSVAPAEADMRYALNLENVFLEKETLGNLQRILGPRIQTLKGSALAIGLTSLNSEEIKRWKQSGQLISEGWEIYWGDTPFQGGFNLTLSETGTSGIIRVEVEDVSKLVSRLEEASVFSSAQARNAKLAAALLPIGQNGKQEITLTLRDGFITLFGLKVLQL